MAIDSHTKTAARSRRWVTGTITTAVLAVGGVAVTAAATGCVEEDGSTNFACHWSGGANRDGVRFYSFGYGWLVIQLGQ